MTSPGARLHCGTRNIVMLQVQGTGARITGLRLDGEYPFTSDVDVAGAIAAESILNGGIGDVSFELDNNEIYGWSWSAL